VPSAAQFSCEYSQSLGRTAFVGAPFAILGFQRKRKFHNVAVPKTLEPALGGMAMFDKRKNIWSEVDALAESLDCGRDQAETTLDKLEVDLLTFPSRERNEVRRKMIFIIAQLSRLEVRLMTSTGPRSSM
jgi:hypothetical protein